MSACDSVSVTPANGQAAPCARVRSPMVRPSIRSPTAMNRATAGTVAVAVGGTGVAVGVLVGVAVSVGVPLGGSGVGVLVLTETTRVSGGKAVGVALGWAQPARRTRRATVAKLRHLFEKTSAVLKTAEVGLGL